MRKINKSSNIPNTLKTAPIPASTADVLISIYRADDVRKQLITDQHYKCAYCERAVSLRYHDVEHFRPKSHYYWLGHEWKNLLFSCEHCNRSYKKELFPLASGSVQSNSPTDDITLEHPLILNPADIEPALHIRFDKYMAEGLTLEGEKTIEVFHLNDMDECPDLIDNRKQLYELYEIEIKKIEIAKQLMSVFQLSQSQRDLCNSVVLLSQKSVENLKSPDRPFSGMLIAQKN